MERERGFNFRLVVPPRLNHGQVSAVRPQETAENGDDVTNGLQKQGYSKCADKEPNMPFPSMSVVAPTKPTRQDFSKMKVVSPMEKDESKCNPGQIYSQLFDEVEKIKCWKVKVDSDTVQKERRLQENKRTIETQRKAIQDLQFGNESLSAKLEEQMSENEDLRNKNNATRNLCNILKDTFQRSAEKMHLFESEREETHHLFMENRASIQSLTAAYESLRNQAEAERKEMQKVKEGLLQFEDLKEKYLEEYNMKEKEVTMLQNKLKEKEVSLQNILLDLNETKKHCQQLQEATNEQHERLKRSALEQNSLLEDLRCAERRCKETEKNCEALAAMLEQSKAEYAEMIQSKDVNLQELSRVKNQQAEQLEQIQTTVQELQNSLASETQRVRDLEDELVTNNKEVERVNTLLEETTVQSANRDEQIKILQDELDTKSKSIESMKGKIDVTEVRVEELSTELSRKSDETHRLKSEVEVSSAENNQLKEACEAAEKAQRDLKEKSTAAQIKVQELEGQLLSEKKKNEQHALQIKQLRKDITHHEATYKALLSNLTELQSEKSDLQQQFDSGSSHVKAIEANLKVSEEEAVKLTREKQRLEEENQSLREEVSAIKDKIQGGSEEAETLQKKTVERCEHLQEDITGKEKQIKVVETKNKTLKKQIAKEIAKSGRLEIVINNLREESHIFQRLTEENHQKYLKDLEAKSSFAAELELEVQKLRLSAAEATKRREEAELKCQHKIADMVALMEKHKNQYDRMVKEKDAELGVAKTKEMQAVTQRKAAESDLEKLRADNDELKQQLKAGATEKDDLQQKLADLKKESSLLKITRVSELMNMQTPVTNRQLKSPESSSKRFPFDLSMARRTQSSSVDDGGSAVTKNAESRSENHKTQRRFSNGVGGSSKIKSYRIRTPPSSQAAHWGGGTIELDPRSDSSDQNDLLSFTGAPPPHRSALRSKLRKSPVPTKSPGSLLKLAAMKRMRDAGWTAVTGCDKKRKRTNEKIFA